MIKNEKQFKITQTWLKDFERSLKLCREEKFANATVHKAMIEGLKSKINDLKKEIREYQRLRDKKPTRLELPSIEDLPEILIQARISHGYTQKQFARKLKMPEQQIQRYEAENYRRVSLETLMRVCRELKVDVAKGSKVRIEY
ncbi:MAG: helix-turn-helix domain-containing protein [Nitrospinales bacterium]